MEITAKEFSYNTGVVTRKQFDDHLTLYRGYVNKVNEITASPLTTADLSSANATYSHFRALKRGLSYALDGVILHELYFENLGERTTPVGRKTQIFFDKYFGGVDKWRENFAATALSARGWCILAYEQRTASCVNFLLDSHDDGLVAGMYPLVVLDMYEHAYFLDYGTDKAAYVNRFMAQVPWDAVERRVGAVG